MNLERGLPANRDAERSILGGVILENAIDLGGLEPGDFYLESHQRIFRAMLAMRAAHIPIDVISLAEELKRRKELESVGGVAYIISLTDGVPRRQALEHYIRLIRDKANLRKIIRVANMAIDDALEQDDSSVDVAERLRSSISDINLDARANRELFLNAIRFMSTVSERVDWMVEGIIQRGANGIIAGVPKASKSWIALELALSCATGSPFLSHFHVPRPCRVALISREDNPSLTGWRTKALFSGRPWNDINLVETNLIVNTRNQSDALFLDKPQDVIALIAELKRHRTELAIFDVFNVLHAKDENDNQEMCEVLAQLKRIQVEAKCSTALVHHFNKNTTGSWTERLRGSSAISGYVEWLIGVTIEDEETKLRKLEFELKAASPPPPFYYQIESQENRCEAFIRQQTVQTKEPKQARFM